MASRMAALRPMRDLLVRLPKLPLNRKQEIDFPAADPALLVAIAEDAEILVGTMHNGVGAIGQLLANSAVMVEDGTISADCLESLGFLMSELGDMAAGCMALAAHCRRETADFNPS
jgi:hypothetical protein